MAELTRIALVVETSSAYGRSVLRGAKRFAEGQTAAVRAGAGLEAAEAGGPRWLFEVVQPHEATAAVLDPHRVAGAIVRLPGEALPEVERSGVPVVMLYELPAESPLHRVGMDNEAVGRAAAGHLRTLEPASFACFGPDTPFAATRARAFAGALRGGGEPEPAWCPAEASEDRAVAWLRGLPKPVNVLAGNDEAGLRLTNLCRAAGCDVPEDVAILGVDNDELLCELCDPPLSSIALPAERVGYEAAALLGRLLAGDAAAPRSVLLPPGEVVHRTSTERLSARDPLVRDALRYLRERAAQPIGVAELLAKLHCSRRHLEQSMKRAIGRTPGQELTRLRIARAKALLGSGTLPLEEVARRCGYRSAVRLSVAFRREVGVAPGAFRQSRRQHLSIGATVKTPGLRPGPRGVGGFWRADDARW